LRQRYLQEISAKTQFTLEIIFGGKPLVFGWRTD